MKRTSATVYRERALLVKVHLGRDKPVGRKGEPAYRHGRPDDSGLTELEQLASTAGAIIVEQLFQNRVTPHNSYYVGPGKAEEIAALAREEEIDVVIFNNDLSPSQIRNLEKEFKIKVIDRTELILDIFATHARTRQAKLQVELAQLEYALPRLKRLWTHLSRIEGGIGIGQRGPGEKQIEIDRRLARNRIVRLKRELDNLDQQRQRVAAARSEDFTVALIGYTNAGKSTLMNALTDTTILVEDKLFSTLDTKTHIWQLRNGHKVLLSDTVGFIRNLPHHLVSSFHATLQEVIQADLLLHVVDASHEEVTMQVESVNRVLAELQCPDKPILLLFNKTDQLDPINRTIIAKQFPEALFISAVKKQGLDELEGQVTELMESSYEELWLNVPAGRGKLLAYINDRGRILEKTYRDTTVRLKVRLGPRDAAYVRNQLTEHAN